MENPSSDVAVIHMYQARQEIYPREIQGRYASLRWFFVWLTQLIFYGFPWLEWNGRQAVLFDLAARKFYIFGIVLWPQDFIYLAALLIICAYSLFLFTAIFGRVWCGFACPQTIYTEIFMWFERKIEGDRSTRMRLDRQPMSVMKFARKTTKHLVWISFALWTGYTFVGYFTPIRVLSQEIVTLSLGSWEWFWVLFYGCATYGNAGWMREQVCKYMCPYARFQSAMFDRDTLVVSYDNTRGEPRGKRSKEENHTATGKGDCIDCGVCVEVCPTGIDIRNGLQYECIGCGLCADACNTIMDRMHYPRGLVRYATLNALEHRLTPAEVKSRFLRPRVVIYAIVIGILSLTVAVSLLVRVPLNVNVIRDRGALAREVDGQFIENSYRLQITNSSHQGHRFIIKPQGLHGLSLIGDSDVFVEGGQNSTAIISLQLPLANVEQLQKGSHKIRIDVTAKDDPALSVSEKAAFFIPR